MIGIKKPDREAGHEETKHFQYSLKTLPGQEIAEAAKNYLQAGLSVIPCDPKSKKPTTAWKPYQETPISDASLFQWAGIAIICGEVSGGLECLDFDERAAWFDDWVRLVTDEAGDLINKVLIQKTQSGGLHIVYRCTEPIPGNAKLASDRGGQCFIETRGAGGYFLAAPSKGYSVKQGDFQSIPIVSANERALLINSAKALNQKPPKPEKIVYHSNNGDRRPGDLYNERGEVLPVLEQHGWKYAGSKGSITHLTRPGKSRGISATVYDGKTLHVFTSNGHPFEMEKSYYPFSVYALLKHNGDYEAAARELASQGYSEPKEVGKYCPEIPTAEVLRAAYEGQKGCARLFVEMFKDRFCYDHSSKFWFEFDKHYWKPEPVGAVYEGLNKLQKLFDVTLAEISRDIIHAGNQRAQTTEQTEIKKIDTKLKQLEAGRKAVETVKNSLNSLSYRKQVVEFSALGKNSLGTSGDTWDLHPWLLACKNGVVDLKTGKLRDGKPSDYIKAFCPTEFDSEADCPNFENFVFEIIGTDLEVCIFLQTLLGAALIGEATYKQYLPIFSGQGRNGKDTLLSVIFHVLGPQIAAPIQAELLLDTGKAARSSQGPSPDKMKLRGLRLAYCNETSQGRRFNTGMVKMLSGGGQMSARPLHGQEVSWEQTHLLLLMTNHRPHAPVDDYAFWQRIKNVHFPLSFVSDPQADNERKADPHLAEKLKDEASGILNWLLEGCKEYQRQGCTLNEPEAVKAASREYLKDVDLLGLFIDDCCFVGQAAQVTTKELYAAYRQWATESGHRPVSKTAFGIYMKKRFEDGRNNTGKRCYFNIGLLKD